MRVFRIHIRPSGGRGGKAASFEYCLSTGVLGMGWQVDSLIGASVTWELYERLAKKKYKHKELRSVRFLKNNIRPGHLLWTRDLRGKYYLARARSTWQYLAESEAHDADITNVVRCDIRPVEQADDVPGSIAATFRPGRTIQSVRNPTAASYSRLLWNELAGYLRGLWRRRRSIRGRGGRTYLRD